MTDQIKQVKQIVEDWATKEKVRLNEAFAQWEKDNPSRNRRMGELVDALREKIADGSLDALEESRKIVDELYRLKEESRFREYISLRGIYRTLQCQGYDIWGDMDILGEDHHIYRIRIEQEGTELVIGYVWVIQLKGSLHVALEWEEGSEA